MKSYRITPALAHRRQAEQHTITIRVTLLESFCRALSVKRKDVAEIIALEWHEHCGTDIRLEQLS